MDSCSRFPNSARGNWLAGKHRPRPGSRPRISQEVRERRAFAATLGPNLRNATLEQLQQIAAIIGRVGHPERVGVCFDTCHALVSGYDFRTPDGYAEVFRQFDAVIGLERLAVFHFNDSQKDSGSRRDRHEAIGDGFVGLEGFRLILNDPRFAEIPMLLETPKSEDMHEDKENLAKLRALIAK